MNGAVEVVAVVIGGGMVGALLADVVQFAGTRLRRPGRPRLTTVPTDEVNEGSVFVEAVSGLDVLEQATTRAITAGRKLIVQCDTDTEFVEVQHLIDGFARAAGARVRFALIRPGCGLDIECGFSSARVPS